MGKTLEQIKNFVQLHTAEMEDAEYIDILRSLAEWANSQADATEYREDNDIEIPTDE